MFRHMNEQFGLAPPRAKPIYRILEVDLGLQMTYASWEMRGKAEVEEGKSLVCNDR